MNVEFKASEHRFSGPLFLVGMPRSGTKLLREMLGRHPGIRFSDIETDFFPYWVKNWSAIARGTGEEQFESVYRWSQKLPFFIQNRQRGIIVDRDEWKSACSTMTPASVFEALMRCCMHIPLTDRSIIWADKSPSYIRHIDLLIKQFPDARIVHIVRDARDYGLSIRQAWGKSVQRAAQRWHDDVSDAMSAGRNHPGSYLEVRYEDLLANPRSCLVSVCDFLEISIEDQMLTIDRVIENLGTARTTHGLLTDNVEKYRVEMSPQLAYKIEQIAGQTLRELGYPCAYRGEPRRLPRWLLWLLQLHDGWNVIVSNGYRYGLVRSIKHNLRYFKVSGNRS